MSTGRWSESMMAKLQELLGERNPRGGGVAVRRAELEAVKETIPSEDPRRYIQTRVQNRTLVQQSLFSAPFFQELAVFSQPLTLKPYLGTSPDFENPAIVTFSGLASGIADTPSQIVLLIQARLYGAAWGNAYGEDLFAYSTRPGTFSIYFVDRLGNFNTNPDAPMEWRIVASRGNYFPIYIENLTVTIEQVNG